MSPDQERPLAQRLARRLTALEPSARLPAARQAIEAWPPDEMVLALAGLLAARERGEARAREALAVVVEAISTLGEQDQITDLLACARANDRKDVARLIERPAPARAYRSEEETFIDRELREQSLGYRKQLARTASRQALLRLLGDPERAVIAPLLQHPKLTEADVIRLAARRPVRAEVLREVYRSARWNVRRRVQRALAMNPYTPTEIALKLAALLPLVDARTLAADGNLHPSVREAASSRVQEADRKVRDVRSSAEKLEPDA